MMMLGLKTNGSAPKRTVLRRAESFFAFFAFAECPGAFAERLCMANGSSCGATERSVTVYGSFCAATECLCTANGSSCAGAKWSVIGNGRAVKGDERFGRYAARACGGAE